MCWRLGKLTKKMKIRGCVKPGRKRATQSHGNIPVGPDPGLRFSLVHSGGPRSHQLTLITTRTQKPTQCPPPNHDSLTETGSFGGSEPGGRVSFGGQPERNAVTWKAAGARLGNLKVELLHHQQDSKVSHQRWADKMCGNFARRRLI